MSDIPDPNTAEIVIRHRNRLAGMWAAELLGLIGKAAHDYVHGLAHHGGDDDHLAQKLTNDLAGRHSLAQVRAKMSHLLDEARRQLGGKP